MALYTVDVYSGSGDYIVRDGHAQGVIIKATQGTGYVNPACNHQYALAKSLGKKLGLYHYASGGNPQAEAQFFINNIRNYVGTATLWLDWESYQNASWGSGNWARAFVNEVHRLTGIYPGIYCQASSLGQVASCAAVSALWVACYPSMNYRSWVVPNMNVSSGAFPFITGWQFTGGDMDRSVFYLDANGWDRLANPNIKNPANVTTGGYLDSVTFNGNNVHIAGWYQDGKWAREGYYYIIVTSKDEKHEYGRTRVKLINRPDINKVYPKIDSDCGFVGDIPYTADMAGKDVKIIFRRCSDPAGNAGFTDLINDYSFNRGQAWLDGLAAHDGKLEVSGWFTSDYAVNHDCRFIILYDADTKRELGRYAWKPVKRDDVQKANVGIYGSDMAGFDVTMPYDENLVGTNVQIIARYSNQADGEGDYKDNWFKPVKYPEMIKTPAQSPKPTQPTQATKPAPKPTQPSQPKQQSQPSAPDKLTELVVPDFEAQVTPDGKIKITYR